MSRIPRSLRSANSSTRADGRLRQEEQPVLRRDYNFLRSDILDDDIEFSRNSGATMTSQEAKICYAPENLITYTDDFSNSQDRFTYRSGHSISHTANQTDPNGGTDAALFANVTGSSANDFWKTVTGLGASAPYIPSFFIKRVSTTGTIRLANPVGGTSNWHINMAALPDDWVRITPSHSAVTVNTPFTAHTNGSGGLWFRSNDGSALSFYLAFPQVERTFDNSSSGKPLDFIENKSGSAVFKERLDHVPETGEKRGFLIEEARTNLFPRSDTNTWEQGLSNDSVIRLNNYAISPAGVKDAPKFITTSNNVLKIIAPTGAHPTIGTSTLFTFSCFIKKGNTDYVRMYHNDSTSFGVTFNLATGQVHSTTNNGDSNIEDYGNDWYRCWYSHTTPSTHSVGSTYIYPTDENSTITHANEWSVYLWQPQAELGGFLTSLIPTYGATADRAADIASVSGSNFSRWFKDTEGTTIVDAQVAKGFDDENSYPRLYSYNDGTTADMIRVYLGSSNKFVGSIRKNSTAIGDKQAPLDLDDDDGGVFRFGQLYKNNRHVVFTNGVQGEVDTTVDVPEDLTQLNIGNRESGAASFNGWIRRFRYFNKAKADAQVLKLTDSDKLLDRFRGAKAAHSLRSLRDGRDNSPVTRIRREYDSFEADYTAAQVSNGDLEKDFRSADQTTLPLDVSVEADELIVGGDFTDIVTNGTFDSDTSGWAAGGGATLAIDSNRLKITNDASGNSYANQTLTTVVGKTYTVSVGYTDDTGGNALIWAGTSFGGNQLGSTTFTATGNYTLTFTATSTTSYLRIGANEATNGTIYFFDNVSVVEGSWTATNAVISFSDNVLTVDDTANAGTDSGAYQNITTQAGKTYTLSFDKISTTSTFYYHLSNALINGSALSGAVSLGTTAGNFTTTFVATSSTSVLKLISGGTGVTKFDNISVKEVNPIATGFSTRKINSSYTGKAMRCRNQGNVEVEVGFDDNDEISLSSPVTNTSQNLLPSSEDFGTNWTLQTCTLEKYSGLDPFGGYNATKITATGGASSGPYHVVPSTASSTYHTFSIYIKAEEATRTRVGFFRTQSSTWVNVETNWSASGIPTTHASSNATNINYEAIGSDGWYRVSLVGITDTATYSTSVNLDPDSGGNNKSAIFFGAQLEETQYESTGTEKLTDGGFDNGLASWTAGGDSSLLSVENGAIRLHTPDGTYTDIHQFHAVTAGKKYEYRADLTFTQDSGNNGAVALGQDYNSSYTQTTHNTSGSILVTRVATATDSSTKFYIKRAGTPTNVLIDNLSVLEYDPIVSEYAQTPVISDTINNTTATTLGEFSGKENLLSYSEAFGSLQAVPTTLTGGQADPFGGADAFEIIGNATHASATVLSGSSTLSIYAKKGTADFLVIRTMNWDAGSTARTWFNLSTGAVGSTDGGAAHTSSSIEAVTGYDGWYRCAVTFNTTSDLTGNAEFYSAETDGGAESSSDSIIAFGMQLNTNSLKTYQKTTGTALTGDVNVVNWYDQAGGEDFTQSTADYQPRIVMGSELVTDSGGKASVYFDGSDNLINATLAGQNRLDAYLTLERGSNTEAVLMSGSGTQHFGLIYDDVSTGQDINLNFGTPSEFINGTQLATTANRNEVHDKLNDQSLFSITNGSTSGFSNFWMGWYNVYNSAFNYNGKISEMVFFPNMDSSTKRFEIEQNMTRHFAIGLIDIDFEDGISVIGKSGTSTIGDAVLSAETTNPISGTQSLKIETTTGNNSSYPRFYTTASAKMTETPVLGDRYKLTFDTKLISGTVKIRQIGFQDGSYDGSHFITPSSGDDDIILSGSQSHSVELTVTDLTSITNTLTFGLDGKYFQGTFLIDNIKVTKVGVTGFVTKLYDQTGNNCHATQSTAAYQPQLVSGGDLIKSGNHPAWEYPSGNPQRYMDIQGMTGIAHLDAFFVHDTSDPQFIYPSSSSGSYYGFVANDNSSSTQTTHNYGGPALEVNGDNKSFSNRDDIEGHLTGRKLVYHRGASTTNWPTFTMSQYASTADSNWNLKNTKFSEWIWYDSDQHSNQSGIESNINTHYNIY